MCVCFHVVTAPLGHLVRFFIETSLSLRVWGTQTLRRSNCCAFAAIYSISPLLPSDRPGDVARLDRARLHRRLKHGAVSSRGGVPDIGVLLGILFQKI
jgi:hypothetical protein